MRGPGARRRRADREVGQRGGRRRPRGGRGCRGGGRPPLPVGPTPRRWGRTQPGAAAAGAGTATSARAPSATGSSGCSSTVGAMPSSACSSRATSGTRDEPPTRNSPASWSRAQPAVADHRGGLVHAPPQQRRGQPLQLLAGQVDAPARRRAPRPGRPRPGRASPWRRARRPRTAGGRASCVGVAGVRRAAATRAGSAAAMTRPRWSTSAASRSRPPSSATPPEPMTANVAAALVAHDRDVERAAAEVEDRERRADRDRAAQDVGEVARRGDRLGHQLRAPAVRADRRPAGPGDRRGQQRPGGAAPHAAG